MPAETTFQDLSEVEIMALCLYGEARGESPVGKLAVAHVVLNRAARPGWWGKDVRSVVLKPQQFSCFNSSDPNYSKLKQQVQNWSYDPACFCVAQLALLGLTIDPTGGATHYCTVNCNATWRSELEYIKRIDGHVFYRECAST